jgi:hypothetical protein
MFAKIYFYTWLAIAAIAAVFYVTGNMTMLAISVFGMLAFGMVFMGMMNVLPSVLEHEATEPLPAKMKERIVPADAVVSIPHGAHSVRV